QAWQTWNRQDFASAIEKFEDSTRIDPMAANAWNGLGWSRLNNGQTDAAQRAFAKAIEIEPQQAGATNGMGFVLFGHPQYAEAKKYWLISLKDPESQAPLYGLVKACLLTGEYEKAADYAGKALKFSPGDKDLEAMATAAAHKQLSKELRDAIEPPDEAQ